jgi:hypothetical protein
MQGSGVRVQAATKRSRVRARWLGGSSARLLLAALTATVAAALAPSSALAAGCTDSWTNTAGGSWYEAANWSTHEVPSSSDEACITAPGSYEVTLEPTASANVEVKTLRVGGASGAQKLRIVSTSGAGGAYVRAYEEVDVAARGTVALTSSGAYESSLETESGNELENSGAIDVEAGAGGERRLRGTVVNEGTINVANNTALLFDSGVFTNAAGGSVAGVGSGHLEVTGATFVEGAGTTSGSAPVISEDSATVEYTGAGASRIVAEGYYTFLKGASSPGQTFVIEGGCGDGQYAAVTTQANFTNGGTIAMSSSGCEAEAFLQAEGATTLTNKGAIDVQAGAGGERRLRGTFTNEGTVNVANNTALLFDTGVFTNAAGGSVAGVGSGHLAVKGTTFVEGAGTTSGSAPVISEDGATVEYTGVGASRIVAEGYYTFLKGASSPGQTFVIEGGCGGGQYAAVTTQANFTNGGTIAMSSSGCEAEAFLQAEGATTLTNKGAIDVQAGAGGERRLRGTVVNEGTVNVANNTALLLDTGVFTNAAGGSVAGVGSGHLAVTATFVEDGGTTSGSAPVVSGTDGTVEYTGTGASRIVAHGYDTRLRGDLSAGQTFVIEAECNYSYAYVTTEGNVTNAGTIAMTSSGCAHEDELRVQSETTLTNTGTISVEAGAGGERDLEGGEVLNKGTVDIANAVALDVNAGSFKNAAGGSVVGTGSGHLALPGGKFVEGAGTTSGSAAVVSGTDGTVEYTGSGASRIVANGYDTRLRGELSAGQTFVIEAECNDSYAYVIAEGNVTNGGTIAMTSGGCAHEDELRVESESTLTNAGTISVEAGAGGERDLTSSGTLLNSGSLSIAAGVQLNVNGPYDQAKAGSLRSAIASGSSFGSLAVHGTATLAGTVEAAPLADFKASAGQTFAIVTATSRSGVFEFERGGAIGGGLYYRPVYSPTGVTLEASETLPEGIPVDSSAPRVYGTPKQGQTLVLTHGAWSHEPFEYSDQWLRCNGSGANCQPIAGATGSSYLLTAADVGHTIRAQETATDSGGEGEPAQSAATALVTVLELHANAGENLTAVAGQAVALDGSGSTPVSEITSYRWEFGDTQASEGAQAVAYHTYADPTAAGKPDLATLTVKHGEETSAPATVQVTVLPAPSAGEELTVTVEDAGGSPLDGAEVVYVASNGAKTQATADSEGNALLADLPAGTDTVYVYAREHQPQAVQASVDAHHHGTVTVKLNSGQLTEAKVKAHEMTLAEIEAAGIDTSDPANNNVYEFELRLAFFKVAPIVLHGSVNGEGEFVGGYGASGGEGGGGGGGGGEGSWSCSPSQCEYTPGEGGEPGEYHIVAHPIEVEGHPLIEWLILKGKATVLKQFFEVSMVMQNLSPEPFKLSAGHAKLNVPAGLSLAPTPEPQSATQGVAAIPGEGSATTSWIVRGDEEGEYYLSAGYEATLEPFGAPVTAQAALAEPLHVWGKAALKLKVEGDEEGLEEGVPWHFLLGVTNVANVPLYNVELAIDEEPHANFDFQPDQQYAEMLGELKPQQTTYVKSPYILVPDANSVEKFNPALSSATFVGEEVKPGEGIGEVPRIVPVYTASALGDTPGAVHLHWQAAPGAEGYEVFSTPKLTTAFNHAPDHVSATPGGTQVTTLPASATDAYVTGVGGEARWYAISAIVDGAPVLDHPVLEASPAPGAPLGITTTSLPEGQARKGYSQTLAASGGDTPYTWSLSSGSLPAGLHLNAQSGAILGTPSAAGKSSFTVQVSDSSSPTPQTASASLSITVAAPAAQAAEYGQCVAQKKGEYTEANCQTKSAKAKKGKFEFKPGAAPSCVAQKKGEYTNSACTVKSAKAKKGTFEKEPGPSFTSSTGALTLSAPELGYTVVCAAGTAKGEVTGTQTGVERLTFTGCESSGRRCTSEGADGTPSGKAGVIVTNLLETRLVGPVSGKVWVQLISSEHEPYSLEYGCEGPLLRTIGSLAGVQGGDVGVSSFASTSTFASAEGEQALASELSEDAGAKWLGPDPSSEVTVATNTAASKTEIRP